MRWPILALGIAILALPSCRTRSTATVAAEVSVGHGHACARMTDGTVRCWGAVGNCQRGDGVGLDFGPWEFLHQNRFVPRSHAQDSETTDQVINLSDVEEISAGGAHTCARRRGGSVWCWGRNAERQIVDMQGQADSLQSGFFPYPVKVPGLSGVVQVSAGRSHTCARRTDGSVWCWGDDLQKQTGHDSFSVAPVPNVSGAVDVRAVGDLTCALLVDGTVRCWGLNDYGQVGGGTSGSNSPPTAVLGVRDGVQIAVAPTHACALGRSGSLTCWGSNVGGQMGDGSLGRGNLRLVPAVVSRLARSTQIMVALDATCGRTTDGKVICFGAGRLGPWELAGLQFATEVSLRSALSEYAERSPERPSGCAVMTNGALGCWGSALPGSHRGEQRSELPLQVRW